jgi:hypothetical protein
VTKEHVLSDPILKRLVGVTKDQSIGWTEGADSQIWGGPTSARTLGELTVSCVCEQCNNIWMQNLDDQFADDVRWWTKNPKARMGEQRLGVVRRYLSKLLLVVRAGEPWAIPEWIMGRGPEPEFFPMSLSTDGPLIRSARFLSATDLALRVHLGVSRIRADASSLVVALPISADGVPDTDKARRLTAGICLTLRLIGLRLYCIHSALDERWQPSWPPNVVTLRPQSRYASLATESDRRSADPSLRFVPGEQIPDVLAMVELALQMAMEESRGHTS